MDKLFYYRIKGISGFSVVHSQIIEEQDCFIYMKYEVNTIFGDWGVPNTAKFIRSIYRIIKIHLLLKI